LLLIYRDLALRINLGEVRVLKKFCIRLRARNQIIGIKVKSKKAFRGRIRIIVIKIPLTQKPIIKIKILLSKNLKICKNLITKLGTHDLATLIVPHDKIRGTPSRIKGINLDRMINLMLICLIGINLETILINLEIILIKLETIQIGPSKVTDIETEAAGEDQGITQMATLLPLSGITMPKAQIIGKINNNQDHVEMRTIMAKIIGNSQPQGAGHKIALHVGKINGKIRHQLDGNHLIGPIIITIIMVTITLTLTLEAEDEVTITVLKTLIKEGVTKTKIIIGKGVTRVINPLYSRFALMVTTSRHATQSALKPVHKNNREDRQLRHLQL
jgi:hypothetical protein